jgi:hypothetical protein
MVYTATRLATRTIFIDWRLRALPLDWPGFCAIDCGARTPSGDARGTGHGTRTEGTSRFAYASPLACSCSLPL